MRPQPACTMVSLKTNVGLGAAGFISQANPLQVKIFPAGDGPEDLLFIMPRYSRVFDCIDRRNGFQNIQIAIQAILDPGGSLFGDLDQRLFKIAGDDPVSQEINQAYRQETKCCQDKAIL